MPLSYLTWTRGRTPSISAALGDLLEESAAPDVDLRAGLQRHVELRSVSAPISRIGIFGKPRASSTASVAAATASQVAPPAMRGRGALGRAVAVAVRP